MKARSLCVSALALSAVAGAHAQTSSVTMYGLLDASAGALSRTAVSDKTKYVLNTDTGASSRIGFKGTEDLGGGLSAIFNLEASAGIDTGAPVTAAASGAAPATANAFFRRNSWIGLAGAFGQITLGRDYTAGILTQAGTMTALTTGINTGFATAVGSQGIGNDFWNSNQIKYRSPRIAGFQFTGAMSAGESNNGNRAGSTAGADLTYVNGPVTIDATYQKDYGSATADLGKSLYWYALSGAFKFGDFRLTAGYDRVNNSKNIATGAVYAGWVDSKMMTVGLAYSVTPLLVVSGQYYQTKELAKSTSTKQSLLEAQYYLSKRTSVYALLNHVSAGNLGARPLWNNADTIVNNSATALAAGIQHSF